MQRARSTERLAATIIPTTDQGTYTVVDSRVIIHNIRVFNNDTDQRIVNIWAGTTKTLAFKLDERTVEGKLSWEPLGKPMVLHEGDKIWIECDKAGVAAAQIYGSLLLDES